MKNAIQDSSRPMYQQAPFVWKQQGPLTCSIWVFKTAVKHNLHASDMANTFLSCVFFMALRGNKKNKTAQPFSFPWLFHIYIFLFMQCVCTYLSLCGGSDGCQFASNLSFHYLYHPSTVTQWWDKMDSPPGAEGSLILCFLLLCLLTQATFHRLHTKM